MVPLAAGLVVLVRFPFSDLSQTKLRPAVVLANAGRGDWILCQVTSKPYADTAAVVLEPRGFPTRFAAGYELCAARQTIHREQRFGGECSRCIAAGMRPRGYRRCCEDPSSFRRVAARVRSRQRPGIPVRF